MTTFACVPLPEPYTDVLRAFLHVAATGQPLTGQSPRRAAATVRTALEAQEAYFRADPARDEAASRAEAAFSRAVGAILAADATAAVVAAHTQQSVA
jgi:hypothetical protein